VVQNQSVLGFESWVCRVLNFLPLRGFPCVVLQRRDGPPAAVGGSNIIGSRHDSLRASGERTRERAALAQHHMGSCQQHHSRGSSVSPAGVGSAGRWAPGSRERTVAAAWVQPQPVLARGGAPTETCRARRHHFNRRVSSGGSCCLPACQLGNPGQLQPLRLLRNILEQRFKIFFFFF